MTRNFSTQNDSDSFKDIPIDRRHLDAKAEKAKKGKLKRDIAGGAARYVSPPSIRDFPKSWLPRPSDRPQIPLTSTGPVHH
jgi:small subunit ribosomal protein S35